MRFCSSTTKEYFVKRILRKVWAIPCGIQCTEDRSTLYPLPVFFVHKIKNITVFI